MRLGDRVLDWMDDHVMPWLATAVIVGILAMVPLLVIAFISSATAESFSLRKDQWQCTASVERASTTYVQIGNVMVPSTTYSKHCTQWSERT